MGLVETSPSAMAALYIAPSTWRAWRILEGESLSFASFEVAGLLAGGPLDHLLIHELGDGVDQFVGRLFDIGQLVQAGEASGGRSVAHEPIQAGIDERQKLPTIEMEGG